MSNLTRRNVLVGACAGAGLTLLEGRLGHLMAATTPGFKETMTTMFWVGEPADAVVWNALGMKENAVTAWRFVDESEVPNGPWTDIITVSGNNR
jgi:hypothetical protein